MRFHSIPLFATAFVLATSRVAGQSPGSASEMDCVYDAMSPELRLAFIGALADPSKRDLVGRQMQDSVLTCVDRYRWSEARTTIALAHAASRVWMEVTVAHLPPTLSVAKLDASFAALSDEEVRFVGAAATPDPNDDDGMEATSELLSQKLEAAGISEVQDKAAAIRYLRLRAGVRMATERWNELARQEAH